MTNVEPLDIEGEGQVSDQTQDMGRRCPGGEDKFQLLWATGTRWQGGVSGLGGGQDPAGTEAGVGGSSGLGVTGPSSPSWAGGQDRVGLAQGPTGMESLALAV